MTSKQEILSEINRIVYTCMSLKGNWVEAFQSGLTVKIDNAINKLDESVGKGLKVGRVVRFSVADGYACYFVIGIGRQFVALQHIPLADCYTSQAVFQGRAMRGTVENLLKWTDQVQEWSTIKQ